MKNFSLNIRIPQETLFRIGTDVSNFHNILPACFKSLKIVEDDLSEKRVLEDICLLGIRLQVKTKHVISPPDCHKVIILSGLLRGTIFNENYKAQDHGTDVTIFVELKINGILKFIPFIDRFIARKMNHIMAEFLYSSEKFLQSHVPG